MTGWSMLIRSCVAAAGALVFLRVVAAGLRSLGEHVDFLERQWQRRRKKSAEAAEETVVEAVSRAG